MKPLRKVYDTLLAVYGPQGWWPILSHRGSNPTKTGAVNGYHPGDFSFPKDNLQRFEICAGAILTQNTGWPQVEKALNNLQAANMLSCKGILDADIGRIGEAIRPAGYFNQKSRYLKEFARFFLLLKRRVPLRKELLAVKGVGEETADSILLYAFKQPEFVVDAYTKRIFKRLGLLEADAKYAFVKYLFETSLDPEVTLYQEYHALIVEHAKRYCKSTPGCDGCPLSRACKRNI